MAILKEFNQLINGKLGALGNAKLPVNSLLSQTVLLNLDPEKSPFIGSGDMPTGGITGLGNTNPATTPIVDATPTNGSDLLKKYGIPVALGVAIYFITK